MNGLPPPKPIMMKERTSMVFLQYGELDVIDGAFVLVDKNGVRTHIPVGSIACIMLETGTRVTHAAVKLAAYVGCLLIWVGDGGVRVYAAGQPGSARVRAMYKMIAQKYRVEWTHRDYDVDNWEGGDRANRCLSAATSCLYGVCEDAILAAGYAPAIGFIHTGKPQSFVYDIADIMKFETVVPIAFKVAAKKQDGEVEREVRLACRDIFRESKMLEKLIPTIEDVLAAGELPKPEPHEEAVPIAIPNEESIGDAGHRS